MTRTYRIGSSRKDKRWSKQCEFDAKSGPNDSQVGHTVYILCLFLSKSALHFLEIITGPQALFNHLVLRSISSFTISKMSCATLIPYAASSAP